MDISSLLKLTANTPASFVMPAYIPHRASICRSLPSSRQPAAAWQQTVVLQPTRTCRDLQPASGLAILLREHPQLSSKLVWHPCGKQSPDAEAMQTVPQNGQAGHLIRHGCVTAAAAILSWAFMRRSQASLGFWHPCASIVT